MDGLGVAAEVAYASPLLVGSTILFLGLDKYLVFTRSVSLVMATTSETGWMMSG